MDRILSSMINLKEYCGVAIPSLIPQIIQIISEQNPQIQVLELKSQFEESTTLQLEQLLSESVIQLVQSAPKIKSIKLQMKGISSDTLKVIGTSLNELETLDINLSKCDEDSVIFLVRECKKLNYLNICKLNNNTSIVSKIW